MDRNNPDISLFLFDKASGKVFWRNPPKNHPRLIGKESGGPVIGTTGKGYWKISIRGKKFSRSRLMFYFSNGFWPDQVDHIDGNSLNDSISNLRAATQTQNAWNHKKRGRKINLPMGVRNLSSGRFSARIIVNHKTIYLGSFETPEEAHLAYKKARLHHYGEFA